MYIDGFNLYYGAAKPFDCRWLDVSALSRRLVPSSVSIGGIKYFTARIKRRDHDPNAQQRQDVYLRALATLPAVEIIYGRFLMNKKTVRRPIQTEGSLPDGNITLPIYAPEEKKTDVNIACHLLMDAFKGKMSRVVLVTNDSDFQTAVNLVETDFGIPVTVVSPNPKGKTSVDLSRAASNVRNLRESVVRSCLLPDSLPGPKGQRITKPPSW